MNGSNSANPTVIEGANWKGSTPAVRDTARGEQGPDDSRHDHQELFRAAVKAITGNNDEPQPAARRRKGETEGDLPKPVVRPAVADAPAARGRYAALQPAKAEQAAFAGDPYAGAWYLSDTLDWLNLWQDNADNGHWHDDDFNAKQERYFPQP